MGYHVVTGDSNFMETDWMKASRERGILKTFVVDHIIEIKSAQGLRLLKIAITISTYEEPLYYSIVKEIKFYSNKLDPPPGNIRIRR